MKNPVIKEIEQELLTENIDNNPTITESIQQFPVELQAQIRDLVGNVFLQGLVKGIVALREYRDRTY